MGTIYLITFVFGISLYLTLETNLASLLSMKFLLGTLLTSLVLAIKVKSKYWRGLLIIIFVGCLGLVNGARVPLSATEQLGPYVGREIVAEGWLEPASIKAKEAANKDDFISAIIQCEKLQCGRETLEYRGRIRVSLQAADIKQILRDKVIVQGKVQKLVSLRNPGGFDGELYNRINNIGGRLAQARLLDSTKLRVNADYTSKEITWERVKQQLALWNLHLREKLKQGLGEKQGALVGSMLLGGSSAVDEETRELFTANGLSHLLSVSGTHLVLLASFLQILFRPLPSQWRKSCLMLGLMAYALLCGLRAPILRALLMCMVLFLGRKQGETGARGTLLCLVAILLLAVKPLWLLDMGFQLSFGATAGLIWLLPACERKLACLEFLPLEIRSGLAVTCAAQIAVLPLLIMHFHQISLISFISNLVLVPLLEIISLLSILGFVPLFGLENISYTVASWLLERVLWQGIFLANLPYSQLVVGELPLWCGFIYYALLLLWADISGVQFWRNFERKLLMAILGISIAAALLWQQFKPWDFTAYFLDVGQGDCVVITTPEHKVIIYDTGGLKYLDTGNRVIAPFLRTLGKSEIDLLILSHYDYDHVGGAVGLLKEIKVKKLVLPYEQLEPSSLALYEAITSEAAVRKTALEVAVDGRYYQLGDGVSLNISLPKAETVAGNDASTVVEVRGPNGRVFLTGDLGSEAEESLDLVNFSGTTVFKAGHHGSKYSNGAEFLARLRPQLTVISCGKDNRYGHPHGETLARLEAVGSSVMRTDLCGSVKVVFANELECFIYGTAGRYSSCKNITN